MNNTRTIDEIRQAYSKGEYRTRLEYPSIPRFAVGHYFDRDKTVAWNEEEKERRINEAKEKRNQYNAESNRLSSKLENDMVEAIMEEYNFNKAQAEKIYSYAYREKHSCMNDVFYFVTELADFFEELQKMK
ncbi:hypothetical protein D3C71_1632940 [compost metagenome]